MRILLDADTPVQMLSVLQHVLPSHEINHVHDINWSKKKDVPLLRDAAKAGYHVFVTNDLNQLDDPDETTAIRRSRMHHVRYVHRHKNLKGLALAIGSVVASLPAVIEELEKVSSPRLVQIRGLDPNQRHHIVDPQREPPRYWK